MLAESVPTLADVPPYINDDNWWMSLKVDGDRFLVELNEGQIVVYNRSGQPKTTNIPLAVLAEFEGTFPHGHWVFDGEMVGRQLILFDLPMAGGLVTPESPFSDRYEALELLIQQWKPNPDNIVFLTVETTKAGKETLLKSAQDQTKEGVMLRHRSGVYKQGRSRQLLKCKFWKTVDAIVTATKLDGHNNVELTLLDPEYTLGATGRVKIGRSSANGKTPVPEALDVWEVKYLYVQTPTAPRLVQPDLVKRRSTFRIDPATGEYVFEGDKAMYECVMDQLDGCYTDKDYTESTRSHE